MLSATNNDTLCIFDLGRWTYDTGYTWAAFLQSSRNSQKRTFSYGECQNRNPWKERKACCLLVIPFTQTCILAPVAGSISLPYSLRSQCSRGGKEGPTQNACIRNTYSLRPHDTLTAPSHTRKDIAGHSNCCWSTDLKGRFSIYGTCSWSLHKRLYGHTPLLCSSASSASHSCCSVLFSI